ncbi:MAG: hypothetical protein ACFBZ8_06395 [Opitutales bacterium]
MKKKSLISSFALVALAVGAQAQDRVLYWNGSTNTNWSTAANWSVLASDASLSAALSAPVSGDVVVLTGGQTNSPNNQDIVGLELEGLWFAPSVEVVTVNGNDIGLVAGGNDFLPGDLVGSLAFDVNFVSAQTTFPLIDTNLDGSFFDDQTSENTAFLLAVQPGATFTQNGGNPQFEDSIASVNPAAATLTTTNPATITETNRFFVLGSRFDLNVDIYLVGDDGDFVEVWIGQEDDGTLALDNAFELNPNNTTDAVGLDFGGDDGSEALSNFGFNYLGDVQLLNTNNTFIGNISTSFTGGDILLASIGPSGDITAAGRGDTLLIPGNTDSNSFSLQGEFTVDRALDSNRNGFQLENEASIDWTGPISLGGGSSGGARIQNFAVFSFGNNSELNLFADVVSTAGNAGIGYVGSGSARVNVLVDQTDTSPLFIENVQYATPSFGLDGASGGLGAGEFIQMNGGADLVYTGTNDVTLTRFIIHVDGNTEIRNESTATLTIDNLWESRRTGNVRGNNFNAVDGPIIFDGEYYNIENGELTFIFSSLTGQSITTTAPVGANFEGDIGNNSPSGADDDSTDLFFSTSVAANPDAVTTVTSAPTGSGNITFEVASLANITPGMLVLGDFVTDTQTTVNSINTTDGTVTISDDGDGSLSISDSITFKGFQPLGYEKLTFRNSTSTINTTLTNVDFDGLSGGAIQFGEGGNSDQVIRGNASFVPFIAGQTIFAQFGQTTLAPGDSIGTMTFGSASLQLGELDLNDIDWEIEISGDQVDKIDAWVNATTGSFGTSGTGGQFDAVDIFFTNIGADSPELGDYVIFESQTGLDFFAAPEDITLVGNFSNRVVTITTDDAFFPTQVILSVEFTEDATTVLDDFLAAFPGANNDPNSDEDNDGSTLLEELIGNTSPVNSGEVPLVEFIIINDSGTDFPGIRFTRPTAPEVTAEAEADDDLVAGGVFTGGVTLFSAGAPFTGNGGVEYEVVEFRSNNPLNAANPQQFLRVAGELVTP